MQSWKQSLDRYLTTPPDNSNEEWWEKVSQFFSEEWWEENEDWWLDEPVVGDWGDRMIDKEYSFEKSAEIFVRGKGLIERWQKTHSLKIKAEKNGKV